MIMLNNNLRIFIIVAEKESITVAANDLYISQPAVSKAIKNLEDELHLKLFYRNKRSGLQLTDVGATILSLARQMADTENRIYQAAFRANNFLGGRVRIASMPIITSSILSKVFCEFKKRYPFVTIDLIEGSSQEIRKAVEEYQVDFALTASPFGTLQSEILFRDKIVAASNHCLLEKVNLHETPGKYIFCRAGHETVMEELRAQKVNLGESLIVQESETAIRMAEHDNGIAIISEFVLSVTPHKLTVLPIEPTIEIEVGLVANSLSDLTPVASELRRMIKEEIQSSFAGSFV